MKTTAALKGGAPGAGRPLLELDERARDLGRREFAVRHGLAGHPLFTLDAIAELADSLPPQAVERHEAAQPLLVPGGCSDLSGRPSDIVRGIEHNRRWLVLWNIEQVSPYNELVDSILDEAQPHVPARDGGMGRREAFLFLSAPRAVTPVHFDPENNFLLQIRGTKDISIGRFPDREWELQELDRYHDGGHRNLERIPPLSSHHRMQPGDGVHIYPWAPHWVHNGPAASISLSVTYRTPRSEREELAHIFNGRLRRYGLAPVPAGDSPWIDSTKAGLISAVGWIRRGGRRKLGARAYSEAGG